MFNNKKEIGKKVYKLITELFFSLGGAIYPLNKEVDNHIVLKFGQIDISVTAHKGVADTRHLIKIKTLNFMVTSDMRFQSDNREVDFVSSEMDAIFSVIKMLLIYNDYVMFQDGKMERSCKPKVEYLAWKMD
jgi:hypothetical protein